MEVGEAIAPDAMYIGAFSGAHEVAVAANGVDFAIVGHHAEWLGEVPEGEGIGRVALVENGEGGLVLFVLQVLEVGSHLGRIEHALINNGTVREGADVEIFYIVLCRLPFRDFLSEKELALVGGDIEVVGLGDEHLQDARLSLLGLLSETAVVDGHVPPTQNAQSFVIDGSFDDLLGP